MIYNFEDKDIIRFVLKNLNAEERKIFRFLLNPPDEYYHTYRNIHAWGVCVFLKIPYKRVKEIFKKIRFLIIEGEQKWDGRM